MMAQSGRPLTTLDAIPSRIFSRNSLTEREEKAAQKETAPFGAVISDVLHIGAVQQV